MCVHQGRFGPIELGAGLRYSAVEILPKREKSPRTTGAEASRIPALTRVCEEKHCHFSSLQVIMRTSSSDAPSKGGANDLGAETACAVVSVPIFQRQKEDAMKFKVKKKSAAQRRLALRDDMWPGADKLVWTRHTDDGYSTVPRTLPLIMTLIQPA